MTDQPTAPGYSLVYRTLTASEVEQQYQVTRSIVDREALIADFIVRSEAFRRESPCRADLRYGPTLDETLDVFLPPARGVSAPVLVFIHGGYWYQFTKREWSFVAEALCARGAIVVVPSYSLCPGVRVTEIVRQMQTLMVWLQSNIAALGGDPERIHVSGHSAGGHMAAALATTDWAGHYGIRSPVAGCTTISGLFDLSPLLHCSLQSHLRLDDDEVTRLDLMARVPVKGFAIDCFVGSLETSEFHRQTADFATAWEAGGGEARHRALPDRNHLTVLYELSDRGGAIADAIASRMGLV